MGKIKKLFKTVIKLYRDSTFVEKWLARFNLGYSLKKRLNKKPKIGIAVLVWERPEYLEQCLDSLFETNLYDYDVTFLLNDDGSKDPKVKQIMEKPRDPKYKIIRNYTEKGHNSWGAAFNKAIRKLMEIDNFDIVGTCDSDSYFNKEWLDQSIKIFLWAKEHHKDHKLIKFSAFNSSDFEFHRVLGSYDSPFGKFVVKERMGDVNNMFFTEDLRKVGFFEESKDDETLKTEFFKEHRLRYFSTQTSYVEHNGMESLLNQWRPVDVEMPNALFPNTTGWPQDLSTFRKKGSSYYTDFERRFLREVFRVTYHNSLSIWIKLTNLVRRIRDYIDYRIALITNYRHLRSHWKKNLQVLNKVSGVSVNYYHYAKTPSNVEVDIVCPLIGRDAPIANFSIQSIHENLKHKVNNIYFVGPDSTELRDLAKKNSGIFVNENEVLPIGIKDVDYMTYNGQTTMNRAGWIFQQLLKFGMHQHVEKEHYYILDSDTILIRPQKFEMDGKMLFQLADEYHESYFRTIPRLTGMTVECPLSFTTHQMFCRVELIEEYLKAVENYCNIDWYKAMIQEADRKTHSGISDYDNFGQYMFSKHRDEIILEYFYNLGIPRTQLDKLEFFKKILKNKYKSISFQYYL